MARTILAVVASLVLILGASLPSYAQGRGGGGGGMRGGGGGGHVMRSGGGHGGHGHGGGHHGGHGHHHGGCCWGWGAGFAFGATFAYPWYAWGYPYPYAYPYSYPYYYGGYPSYYPYTEYTSQLVISQQSAPPSQQQVAATSQPQMAVQRELVYPQGKYLLMGDGVTRAWQWVWAPALSPPGDGLARTQ